MRFCLEAQNLILENLPQEKTEAVEEAPSGLDLGERDVQVLTRVEALSLRRQHRQRAREDADAQCSRRGAGSRRSAAANSAKREGQVSGSCFSLSIPFGLSVNAFVLCRPAGNTRPA